ncbi:MAG: hypothetical protein ACKVIH_08630 [Burkholderiales bacterium]
MKKLIVLALAVLLYAGAFAWAADAHSAKETQQDISRHKAMAAAHEAAAKCLESGTAHAVCHKAMQAACKGLAIGAACGMKHQH